MTETIENYVAWLQKANRAVFDKEAQAKACLNEADYAQAYKGLMAEKAGLIQQLPSGFRDAFSEKDESSRAAWEHIVNRLSEFAMGAENALSIGSPFYMSALLYPDEHQPGEPNNLELLIAELQRK